MSNDVTVVDNFARVLDTNRMGEVTVVIEDGVMPRVGEQIAIQVLGDELVEAAQASLTDDELEALKAAFPLEDDEEPSNV